MYLYYNTLFEKKQPFFVRKFKFLIHFSRFRYNLLIFAQEKVSNFVNFFSVLVVDKTGHTIYSSSNFFGPVAATALNQARMSSFLSFSAYRRSKTVADREKKKSCRQRSKVFEHVLSGALFILFASKSVSRVLYQAVIYLGRALPQRLGATSTGRPSKPVVPPRCCFG